MAFDSWQDLALDELPDRVAGHFFFRAEQLVELVEVEVLEKISHMYSSLRHLNRRYRQTGNQPARMTTLTSLRPDEPTKPQFFDRCLIRGHQISLYKK